MIVWHRDGVYACRAWLCHRRCRLCVSHRPPIWPCDRTTNLARTDGRSTPTDRQRELIGTHRRSRSYYRPPPIPLLWPIASDAERYDCSPCIARAKTRDDTVSWSDSFFLNKSRTGVATLDTASKHRLCPSPSFACRFITRPTADRVRRRRDQTRVWHRAAPRATNRCARAPRNAERAQTRHYCDRSGSRRCDR